MAGSRTGSKAEQLVLIILVLLSAGEVSAQSSLPRPRRQVLVSIPDRKLAVLEGDQILEILSVSVGASISPSPMGTFQIVNRVANPTYYHPGQVIPPGSSNPIGTRWIGLNKKGYGIHGTNVPSSIGKAASHGCIRLRNHDIEKLFSLLRVGDRVEIRGERDPQIAQIFGGNDAAETVAQARSTMAEGGQ